MQWLIDLMLERIRSDGMYVYRGDPAAKDFLTGDFTINSAWHELDLSAIVPEPAHLVLLAVAVKATAISRRFMVRRVGSGFVHNNDLLRTQVANVFINSSMTVSLDSTRVIEYLADVNVDDIRLTVRGWWY